MTPVAHNGITYYKIIRNYQQTCMWSQKIIKAETTLESLELIH